MGPRSRVDHAGPFRALDWTFELRGDVAAVDYLAERFELLRTSSTARSVIDISVDTGDRWSVEMDGRPYLSGQPSEAVALVMQAINRRALGELRSGVPLHAGAVADEARAVVFCGPSHAGKSTLTAACVQAGFAYVADEIAVLMPTDHGYDVRRYRRPIGLRWRSREVLGLADREHQRWIDDVDLWRPPIAEGGQGASPDVCLLAVVLLDRSEKPPGIERLRPPVALTRLAEHSLHPPDTRQAFRLAESLCRTLPVWQLTYSDAVTAVDGVREIVDGSAVA